MRRQQAVRHVETGGHGQAHPQQVGVAALGDGVHQRHQHDEADVEQVRHADQQCRGGDGRRDPLHGPGTDEDGGDAVGAAGAEQDAAQQGAEADGGTAAAQGVPEPVLEGLDGTHRGDAGGDAEPEGGQGERQERVQLGLGDQQDQDDDGGGTEEEVLEVGAHTVGTPSVPRGQPREARPARQALSRPGSGSARSATRNSSPAATGRARVAWAAR